MTKEDYMKLPKERLAELLAERDAQPPQVYPVFPSIIQMPRQPMCYEPDGICTNPQMDCINCPKRGMTGGIGSSWCTNSKGTVTNDNVVKPLND